MTVLFLASPEIDVSNTNSIVSGREGVDVGKGNGVEVDLGVTEAGTRTVGEGNGVVSGRLVVLIANWQDVKRIHKPPIRKRDAIIFSPG